MNGVAPTALPKLEELRTSWVIAYTSLSEGYFGRQRAEGPSGEIRLSPVYALLGGYQVSPQGAARAMILTPVEMLADLTEVRVRPVSTLYLAQLSDADLRQLGTNLLKNIEVAESMRTAIRSQRAGIVLAPAGLKLPPAPVKS